MPDLRDLVDEDGELIARYEHVVDEGRPIADVLELAVPVERALPVVLRELQGMLVAAPVELAHALAAAGGTVGRHAHLYSHALDVVPAEPTGLFALDRPAADLLPAYHAAFPDGHPDRTLGAARHLAGIMAGRLGPLLDASGMALDGDEVIGAILVARLDGTPWVMELFRDPAYPGVGRALLERALARCPGPSLGLTVTEGNPAERLYGALGFQRVRTTLSVEL